MTQRLENRPTGSPIYLRGQEMFSQLLLLGDRKYLNITSRYERERERGQLYQRHISDRSAQTRCRCPATTDNTASDRGSTKKLRHIYGISILVRERESSTATTTTENRIWGYIPTMYNREAIREPCAAAAKISEGLHHFLVPQLCESLRTRCSWGDSKIKICTEKILAGCVQNATVACELLLPPLLTAPTQRAPSLTTPLAVHPF